MTIALLDVAVWFPAGLAVGVLYFAGLWWNVRWFADRRHAGMHLLLLLGRIAGLGGTLALAAAVGAMPLLLMGLGVCIARAAVVRRLQAAAA